MSKLTVTTHVPSARGVSDGRVPTFHLTPRRPLP
jgi:hypothetical protein